MWDDHTAERRFRWVAIILLLASVAVGGAAMIVDSTGQVRFLIAVGVVVLAAGWTLATLPARKKTYFVGRVVLTAVLVGLNPWFGIYAWFGYVEGPRFFQGRAVYVAIGLIAPLAAVSYLGGYPTSIPLAVLWVLLSAGGWALASTVSSAVVKSNQKEAERERVLAELTVTNGRLAEALAENRGLQTQLLTQAREAGALDERTRLAGEIHDTLAQALTGIIRQLEAAEVAGELHPGSSRPHVDRAAELARDGLSEARRSLRSLRPGQLVDSTLAGAIAEVARRAALPVEVEVTGPERPLPTVQEVVLLRVVQEALTNIDKHAGATRVGVTLSYVPDEVIVDVRDDGVGFDPERVAAVPRADGTGLGLLAMRDRLALVSGTLVLESTPGEGTALVATVPTVATRQAAAPSVVAAPVAQAVGAA